MKATLFLLGAFVFPCTTVAQVFVSGAVVDSSGNPVPLVVVSVADKSVMTDSDGLFRLSGLTAGGQSVTFHRIGYGDRMLLVAAPNDGTEYRMGTVILQQLPEVLDEISVEALEPIMTQRGINAFNFNRREGVARYFFTAYDIERMNLQEVSQIARYVPGGQMRVTPEWGNTVQLLGRRGLCTASVTVDGVESKNPSPDISLIPERIGAIWFTPSECRMEVWTKPTAVGQTSPFEFGIRAGTGFRTGDGFGTIGGYLVAPVLGGRLELSPAFDAGLQNADREWQLQFSARIRVVNVDQPWYVGTGVSFVEERMPLFLDPVNSVSHILLGGLNLDVGPVRGFGELQVADLVTPGPTRFRLYSGVGVRHR